MLDRIMDTAMKHFLKAYVVKLQVPFYSSAFSRYSVHRTALSQKENQS